MPVKYYRLFDLLNRRGMKKTDLLEVISAPTLAKLSKGKTVTTEVISNICEFLQCQPGDIMEYVKPPTEEEYGTEPNSTEDTEQQSTLAEKPEQPESPPDDDDLPGFMREDYGKESEPQKELDPVPEEVDYDELPLFMQKHFKKNS